MFAQDSLEKLTKVNPQCSEFRRTPSRRSSPWKPTAPVLWRKNFSGSCTVTSRNPLIHIVATTATKSERFDPKRCARAFCHGVAAVPDGLLATPNFAEFSFFFPRTLVNKDKDRKGRGW